MASLRHSHAIGIQRILLAYVAYLIDFGPCNDGGLVNRQDPSRSTSIQRTNAAIDPSSILLRILCNNLLCLLWSKILTVVGLGHLSNTGFIKRK